MGNCGAEERKGSVSYNLSSKMRGFKGFIEDLNLFDLPCRGNAFSWFIGDGRSMSGLHRFLCSSTLIDRWGIEGQKIGKRDISDHCPIWIMIHNFNWGPKSFKDIDS